ncbi:unnamed protein product [Fraxinus pennsylvanica]|uniref:Hexosyltransferase n=1 Tax=Fraxinus pennsylvanica TaxID=56036 RepID=A0AAD2DIM7_9LAMI|nr:unnamed protein product [Fraxinus pennsylvanica]
MWMLINQALEEDEEAREIEFQIWTTTFQIPADTMPMLTACMYPGLESSFTSTDCTSGDPWLLFFQSVNTHLALKYNLPFVSSIAPDTSHLNLTIAKSFPYLQINFYPFDDLSVARLISTSIRAALDCPLNYARNYLTDLLPECVQKVVYLDSDLVLVDDIAKLAATPLGDKAVLAAPEYCNANFTSYFTPTF